MSQPVASPVPDAAAGSPGPAPSRRSSALDSILRASEERYSPNNFYGLDLKYRNDPRYNPKSHFVTIAKGAGRSSPLSPASSPRSPRPVRVWANSPLLCGVGLSRSLSLPTVLPSDDEAGPYPRPAALASYRCPVPRSGGICVHRPNAASEMACVYCGVVDAGGVAKVSQEYASNRPKAEARDQVGEVQRGSASQASYDAWANGPEQRKDRDNRVRAWAGGTQMSQRQARKMDVQQVHNAINRQACSDARKRIEGEACEELIRRKIIDVLEIVFKQINGLHKSVMKHIRIKAAHLYASSMQHEAVCAVTGCMFSLSQRSNMAVAYGVTEFVLTWLRTHPEELAQITDGNVTQQQIKEQLSQVKQLQLVPSGHSQLQQVTSAIGLISRWDPTDACKPCPAVEAVPPELALPPSIAMTHEEYGRGGRKTDPSDVTVKLRLQIQATAKLSGTRDDARNLALKYLALPQIVTLLTHPEHQRWSVQLLACLQICAVESKMEMPDSTAMLRKNLLGAEDIVESTFLKSAGKLEVLMQKQAAPKTLDEEDEINGLNENY